ncbi:MAG: hypothetical protein U0002_13110 [Thermoanaerobaculia bacterium]
MKHTHRDELREWLYLRPASELAPGQQAELEQACASDAELAAERDQIERMDVLLAAELLAVRPNFRQAVMSNLPPAGWEAQHPRTWKWAMVLLLALAGGSAALLGVGSARLSSEGAFVGAFAAVADLFKSAALAGAGLLAASWKGLGMTLSHLADGSKLTAITLAVTALCLNGLFFVLWRSSRRSEVPSLAGRGEGSLPPAEPGS